MNPIFQTTCTPKKPEDFVKEEAEKALSSNKPLSTIPVELIEQIFLFLSPREAAIGVNLVNKDWNSLTNYDSLFWKTHYVEKLTKFIDYHDFPDSWGPASIYRPSVSINNQIVPCISGHGQLIWTKYLFQDGSEKYLYKHCLEKNVEAIIKNTQGDLGILLELNHQSIFLGLRGYHLVSKAKFFYSLSSQESIKNSIRLKKFNVLKPKINKYITWMNDHIEKKIQNAVCNNEELFRKLEVSNWSHLSKVIEFNCDYEGNLIPKIKKADDETHKKFKYLIKFYPQWLEGINVNIVQWRNAGYFYFNDCVARYVLNLTAESLTKKLGTEITILNEKDLLKFHEEEMNDRSDILTSQITFVKI